MEYYQTRLLVYREPGENRVVGLRLSSLGKVPGGPGVEEDGLKIKGRG